MRFTPDPVMTLQKNEVFVFGSNEAGIHGAGAARAAVAFGAVNGRGFGPCGQTYAIPTKDWHIETLDLETIRTYVSSFLRYARSRPDKTFLVTKIGCGLAGLAVEDVAPMFSGRPANVVLPEEFYDYVVV